VSDVFLFPGQGAEQPGMGGDALKRPGPVRTLLDRASRSLDVELAEIVERGTPQLARPEIGQPALLAIEIGLALESGVQPALVAGHSAGELAAFCLAGCLEPEETIDLVVARARFQAEAAAQAKGTMVAVRAASEAELPPYELAAHNSPDEWVLTGERSALAPLGTVLPVGGPWHSRAMAPAADRWRPVLARAQWKPPRAKLIVNATGSELAGDPVEALAGQLTRPVRWAESMQTLKALGGSRWHVFGPGRVMRGLCRANLGHDANVVMHA
jgi:[acyl-carrier-protein] S-malonyltransferase